MIRFPGLLDWYRFESEMMTQPTIFALSSGFGRAGIAVVRVSGSQAGQAVIGLTGSLPAPRQAVLRKLRHPSRSTPDDTVIDHGLVLWFPAPATVTGEDVAEFHLHGSPAVVDAMLQALSDLPGFKPAEPGEFSRRAFANGRMDLVEVEGLSDLLAAETESQRRIAMRQFSGAASSVYEDWRRQLIAACSMIEASIDFADEDGVAEEAVAQVRPQLERLLQSLTQALQASQQAAAIRRGLRIVIAGAPNVGKSSLLNALAMRDAAIVSPIAGTTRDVVEAALVLNGVAVSLADTAGLRTNTDDLIEREGMARSEAEVHAADILVWVTAHDDGDKLEPPRRPDLVVLNKIDVLEDGQRLDSIQMWNDAGMAVLPVSVKTGEGMAALRKDLAQMTAQCTSVAPDAVMVRARHQRAVSDSIRLLNDAINQPMASLELMADDMRKAAQSLAGITGRVDVEDFLDQIFREFCIGK